MPGKLAAIAAILLAGGLILDWIVGSMFIQPIRSRIGDPPADLGATNITFGDTLRGWFVPGQPDRGAVLLLHGVHADRRVMLDRARWLHREGFAVLLFDFQAHGESSGAHVTFGGREAHDVAIALAVLRQRAPGERIGAIGVSQGGAALLLAPRPLGVDALVLESVYPTIEATTIHRVGPIFAPLLLWQLGPRLGFSTRDLRPIDHIGDVEAPVFVLSGADDRWTTPEETRAMFDRAPEPKDLWMVPGAAHVDLHDVAGPEYERRVLAFLDRYVSRSRSARNGRSMILPIPTPTTNDPTK